MKKFALFKYQPSGAPGVLKRYGRGLLAAAAFFAAAGIFLLANGGLPRLNSPSGEQYPVRGVDVSVYQGGIDWKTLAEQGISFAFIKATEGSSSVDPNFCWNYSQARQSGLRIGAYHFFSFDSNGAAQAENFICVVEPFEGMLPPVVDVELYGSKKMHPPAREEVTEQLTVLLERLEDHYGLRPVIYATGSAYERYLTGSYAGYDIWIRNVYSAPRLKDGRDWTFWQYTDRGRLDGYAGEEPYIDLNVFNGTEEEFAAYPAR